MTIIPRRDHISEFLLLVLVALCLAAALMSSSQAQDFKHIKKNGVEKILPNYPIEQIQVTDITNFAFICPLLDPTGLTDSADLAQNCFNIGYANGQTVFFPKGTYLFNTAQNWTNKPVFKVECAGSQYQLSSQSPIAGGGTTVFIGNTGGVLIDTTGSSDSHIKNCTIYRTATATPSTIGILQGRDNAGGGGAGNPFCFEQKYDYDNVNIIDFTHNTTANSARGFVGIYNVGAENGYYHNLGIHAGTPIVLASTNILGISSPFQTLATGCPSFMTEVHMDSVVTDSFTSVTPNIEASGAYSIHLTNHEFIGGNAGILFEGATTGNWDVNGAQESTIGTAYALRSRVNVRDSSFHIEAPGPTAFLNPEANNLVFTNNDFKFNTDLVRVPFITNTATGTVISGGRFPVSQTTNASNTTVNGAMVFATVPHTRLAFNAASSFFLFASDGMFTIGTVKFGSSGTGKSNVQEQSVSTGSIGATTRTEVFLTWATTMGDTNYKVQCSVQDSTTAAGTQGLTFERIRTLSSTRVGAVINNPTAGAITGTLFCTGTHP
jgi:hypothetical protein